jgi:DNA invertase Pin-like site-specific DNA recombinase
MQQTQAMKVVLVKEPSSAGESMKAGVYLRVSTPEQETQNQLPALLHLCAARGWEPDVREEVESGKKARPVLDALCADAHRGVVGAVVVWKLDRLGRNKLEAAVRIARLLAIPKLALVSYQETWIEQPSAVRSLMVDIFTWQAEDEHRNIVERTKAGLARAKAEGVQLGRPRVSDTRLAEARKQLLDGHTIVGAAKLARISESSLRRDLRLHPVKKGA